MEFEGGIEPNDLQRRVREGVEHSGKDGSEVAKISDAFAVFG